MQPTDPTHPGQFDPTRTGQTPTATPYSHYPEGCSVKDHLLNRDVYNELDEKIGDLRDVILGADGRAHYYVIGVGGFLGMGEHDVRVACDHIEHTADRFVLRGYTKEQLKALPSTQHVRRI